LPFKCEIRIRDESRRNAVEKMYDKAFVDDA
jgi:hypothetical protein